jgi:hypothetical protein
MFPDNIAAYLASVHTLTYVAWAFIALCVVAPVVIIATDRTT